MPGHRPGPGRPARRGSRPRSTASRRFCRLLLEAALPHAAAVKPNLAFFEAHGSAGVAVLERLRALVPASVPFVADAKRGDIGTTAQRQATALYDALGADAVTVNPYLGEEAIEPLLARADRFAYVLCRTSNPGAAELQGLRRGRGRGQRAAPPSRCGHGSPGARRRGARAGPSGSSSAPRRPRSSAAIRSIAPGLAFLVPGVGAQGGATEPVLADGPATARPAGGRPGGGLLVNVSRGIAQAALGEPDPGVPTDPGERLAAAAAEWARRLPVLP